MTDEAAVINSRKYDLSIRRSWNCRLIRRFDRLLVFVGEFETEVGHSDLGLIRRGTVSYEYYWLDRWYNVFRFHEPDGPLRNFYCNINMPPTYEKGLLDYVDLDIDVLVRPDLSYTVLDMDEFEANRRKNNYSQEVVANAERALGEVIESIRLREFPFDLELFPAIREK